MSIEETLRSIVRVEVGQVIREALAQRFETRPSETDPSSVSHELFETAEAAKLLRITPATIRRMASRNEIRCVRIGRKVLIPSAEIDRIIAEEPMTSDDDRVADLATELLSRLATKNTENSK